MSEESGRGSLVAGPADAALPRSPGIGVLLRLRLHILRNNLARGTAQDRRRARAGLLATALMVLVVGFFSASFFEPLVSTAAGRPELQQALMRVPAFGLFSAFWMLLLSAVTVGIQTFFLNHEFVLLLATPLRPRTVFAAKFLEATAANAGLFLSIGGPMFVAFAHTLGLLTAGYVLRLVVVLAAFSALPTAVGVLASFLLMRVLPASRTRDLLAALGITAFAAIYIGLSIAVRNMPEHAGRDAAARIVAVVESPVMRVGPWAWAGDALSGATASGPAWSLVGWLCLAAATAVWVASMAAQWMHWRGWAAAQETATSARPRSGAASAAADWERRLAVLPGPTRGVLLKDMRTLRRDLRQLSMLFIPVAAMAVFIYNSAETPQFRAISSLLFMQTLFLLLAPIALRLSMSAFVSESRAMWLVMCAPGDPWRMLLGKFLYAYLLSLPLGLASTLLYARLMEMPAGETGLGVLMVACAAAGLCGIGVGASALFADFGQDNPRFAVSVGARLATFAFQAVYLVLLTAVALSVWLLARLGMPMAGLAFAAAAIVVLALSVGFVAGPLALAARRLRRLEW